MKTLKIFICLALFSLLFLGQSRQLHAFDFVSDIFGDYVHWSTGHTNMDLNPTSFPDEDPETGEPDPYTQALIESMEEWTNVLGSHFYFTKTFEYQDPNNTGDNENAVLWVSSNCDDWSAKTYRDWNNFTGHMHNADIHFDADCNWVTSLPGRESDDTVGEEGVKSFRSVSLHELGHAIALKHQWGLPSIMNYSRPMERLLADDKFGIRWQYTIDHIADIDLTITNGADGDPAPGMRYVDAPIPQVIGQGELGQVEFTVENHGNVDVPSAEISFRIGDYPTGPGAGMAVYLPGFSSGTYWGWFYVPEDMPPGDYPIYVAVDAPNEYAESNENNNELPNPRGLLTVTQENRPPYVAMITDRTISEGIDLLVHAYAYDPDGDALTYFAENLPDGARFQQSDQFERWYDIEWTPRYDQAGLYENIRLTFTDSHGDSTSETFNILVLEKVPTPQNLDGVSGSCSVDLTWEIEETSGPCLFEIFRASTPEGLYEALDSSVSEHSYTDEQLTVDGVYYYRVRAIEDGETGWFSGMLSVDVRGCWDNIGSRNHTVPQPSIDHSNYEIEGR